MRNAEKKKEADRKYQEANKEKVRAYGREYAAAHREEANARAKAWYRANKERALATRKRYVERNPELKKKQDRDYFLALRVEVLAGYGGACVCCGEKEPKFLAVSQTNSLGTLQRKGLSSGGAFYNWLVKNGFPSIFTLLCLNCNHGSYRNGGSCPHTGVRSSVGEERARVIKEYGGQCECCKETEPFFLEVDHVYDDGHRHRLVQPGSSDINQWLITNAFPKAGFRLLCSNCNVGRSLNGGVCPHCG